MKYLKDCNVYSFRYFLNASRTLVFDTFSY